MKKLFSMIAVLLISGSTLISAQETGQFTMNMYGAYAPNLAMVDAGRGLATAFGEVFATIFTFGLYKPGSNSFARTEKQLMPLVGVQAGYQILPWLQITGDLTYDYAHQRFYRNEEDMDPEKVYTAHRLALLPGCKFTYLNKGFFHMYSSVHLGVAVRMDITNGEKDPKVLFAHELGLLGFHFGNKVYANLEIGVGSEYYGLKGGIGYWF
jgi:hypothetical protein